MNVKIVNQPLTHISADLTLEFVTPAQLEAHPHRSLLSQAGFKADLEQLCALHEHRLLVCGIDNNASNELYRSAMAAAIRTAMNYGYSSLKVAQYTPKDFIALIEGA